MIKLRVWLTTSTYPSIWSEKSKWTASLFWIYTTKIAKNDSGTWYLDLKWWIWEYHANATPPKRTKLPHDEDQKSSCKQWGTPHLREPINYHKNIIKVSLSSWKSQHKSIKTSSQGAVGIGKDMYNLVFFDWPLLVRQIIHFYTNRVTFLLNCGQLYRFPTMPIILSLLKWPPRCNSEINTSFTDPLGIHR